MNEWMNGLYASADLPTGFFWGGFDTDSTNIRIESAAETILIGGALQLLPIPHYILWLTCNDIPKDCISDSEQKQDSKCKMQPSLLSS